MSPAITGRREPWDVNGYFYPGALFLAGLLSGAVTPRHPRATALGVFTGQAAVLLAGLAIRPGDGGLWPLGLIFLAVYSLVALLGAALADVIAARSRGSRLVPAVWIALIGQASTVAAQGRQAAPDAGQWTMPGRDHAVTPFSPLRDITGSNAPRLRPTWTFSTGDDLEESLRGRFLGSGRGQKLLWRLRWRRLSLDFLRPASGHARVWGSSTYGVDLEGRHLPAVHPTPEGLTRDHHLVK